MNGEIFIFLLQDGLGNGAIYALLAIAIVLVFAVARVLFIPQGEFVVFGAFAMASIQAGQPSALIWLAVAMACIETVVDGIEAIRKGRGLSAGGVGAKVMVPFGVAILLYTLPLADLPIIFQAALAIAVIAPMGPQIYRLCYQPVAAASMLVLLMVSIVVHVGLVSLGLLLLGPQGSQTRPFVAGEFDIMGFPVSIQIIWVILISAALVVLMHGYFGRALFGKALRATAMNRTGARLVGVSPVFSGRLVFLIAAFIGASSGILIAPITPLYYDSGLLIALKGFVGAVIGAMAGYPLAAVGSVVVGLLEAFAAFWASLYKEVIVFTLLLPILLWRSYASSHAEEEE